MKRNLDQWLAEYNVSHQHPTNIKIHNVCVPFILLSVTGLLTKLFEDILPQGIPLLSGGNLFLFVLMVFYGFQDRRLPRVMAPLLFLCAVVVTWLSRTQLSRNHPTIFTLIFAVIFILAWILQFIGHRIEGRGPSFLTDIRFLFIGPVWVMVHLRRRWGDRDI